MMRSDIDGKGRPDNDDIPALISLEDEDFLNAHATRRKKMRLRHTWFNDDKRATLYKEQKLIRGKKLLAIGFSAFYEAFMDQLTQEYGSRVYQSDFMEWIDPGDPYVSLLFFLKTAREIHVNLEGITGKTLLDSTTGAKGPLTHRTDVIPYMTIWEINQVFWRKNLSRKAFWHCRRSPLKEVEIEEILCPIINARKIVY
jgi:hypothetical protein